MGARARVSAVAVHEAKLLHAEECRYGRLLYVSAVRHVRDVSCGELAHLSLLPLGVAFDLTRRRIVRVKYEVIVSHKVVVARQRRKAVLRTRSRVLGCAFKNQHSPLARLRGVISVITRGALQLLHGFEWFGTYSLHTTVNPC